jgi:hypothetical protein
MATEMPWPAFPCASGPSNFGPCCENTRPPPTLKLAVTFAFPFMVKLHPPVPEHGPLHPVKVEPPVAVAVNDTPVPPG